MPFRSFVIIGAIKTTSESEFCLVFLLKSYPKLVGQRWINNKATQYQIPLMTFDQLLSEVFYFYLFSLTIPKWPSMVFDYIYLGYGITNPPPEMDGKCLSQSSSPLMPR